MTTSAIPIEELVSRYLDGESLRSIGSSVGISHEAVRVRLDRCGITRRGYAPDKMPWGKVHSPDKRGSLTRFRIPPDLYARAMKRQGGKCGMCREARKLCVDHCHKSGRFRGLLCISCNFFVGVIEHTSRRIENVELLDAALEYLSSPHY